ncbi:MAG: dTDP-4-dehydrorhamnose reductase [Candidatus Nanopelagicales bacterium]|nr:dTDP-4-dehydrorhamnose reductase [Candidatus Nanopelagicales bacterium]MCF8537163.1 dTDP-4-dehydrorhamnose reductase [Candidatus Nanopelagicales bacterium]MCF8556442.1 dTDP-4-dehydrorhamnose reductase [Candidatus Nanopelagicales bacterium]
MRVLVIGCNGQLGSALMPVLARNRSLAVLGIDYPDIDIADPHSIDLVFGGFDPDFVINCAAYTAVDDAETNEDMAMRINGLGPRYLADECRKSGTWMVHVSTDYVFDGSATSPYAEDETPSPASAYGRTKLAGDQAVQELLPASHYLIRTAWLYGLQGSNFVKTMLRLEKERDTVSVVTDQVGQPTYAADLATQIGLLLDRHPAPGTYHGTNSGEVSWFEFTREIFRLAGADPDRVLPTTSAEFVRPAPRPAYSVLGHDRWMQEGLPEMRPWREALEQAFEDGISTD